MKTYNLLVDTMQSPDEVALFLKENNVQRGDLLKVLTDKKNDNLALKGLIFIIVIAIVYWLVKQKDKQEKQGEKILSDIFQGKSVEEIELQVEKEYGIRIEVEQKEDEEYSFWQKVSLKGMAKAYDTDEPDYSDVTLMEPNPKYIPWKKDQ